MCQQCRDREGTSMPPDAGPYESNFGGGIEQGWGGVVVTGLPNIEAIPPTQWMQTPKKPDRLYCLPMSEQMHATIAELYERDIESSYEPDERVEIEVWSVTDNIKWMPSIDRILDEISVLAEGLEVNEFWWEKFETALGHPDTRIKVAELRTIIASKIDFWMADKEIGTMTIDINGGFPLVNGEPVYKREPLR